MRLTIKRTASVLSITALCLIAATAAGPVAAQAPSAAPAASPAATASASDKPQDILGNMVVTAGASRALPKVAVVPSLSSDMGDVVARSVVQRDLDLCGEFEVLPDASAPEGAYADSPVDMKVWSKKGVEAVVRLQATTTGDTVALTAQAYLSTKGSTAVFEKKASAKSDAVREEAHRLADALIGALTGQNGGFASRMMFTSGVRELRRAYVIDSDGNGAHTVSPADETAIASAFGPKEEPYWVSSKDNGEYAVRTKSGPVTLPVKGSVYGLAFSKDRSQVAVSIAQTEGIKMFLGPDLASIKLYSETTRALQPTFTPSGKLAFAGAGKHTQRLYVDGKAITPEGLQVSSPTFCKHPDGVLAVFAAGNGKDTDLVRTGENGGGLARLTQGQGSNGYPACSPDGRLVAFFSTRTSGEGPGLYIMRVDGLRPKRISTLMGTSLRWDPLPAPAPASTPAPAPPSTSTPAASATPPGSTPQGSASAR
jgi:TolB protein